MSEWAIPVGEEGIALAMLGKGETLAGCTLADAAIDKTHLNATYQCGEAKAVVVLDHVSKASAVKTEKFALSVGEPPPSPELMDAVAAHVRAQEAQWKWVEVPGVGAAQAPGAPATPAVNPAVWGGLVLLVGLILFFVLRRQTPPAKPP
jgi:hypothetical protein